MPTLGEKIGPFRLEKSLGSGGLGEVFLASRDGKPFALKFLKSGLDAGALAWFHREVRCLSQLSHPNLVRILDFFVPERSGYPAPCFVMEYLEGGTLEGLAPDDPRLKDFFLQACLALHYLHSKGILHRDLKPGNLFLTRQGQIKVLDFSLSIPREEGRVPTEAAGTYPFMAPETFLGKFSERSDLFALGALFYKTATGHWPYSKPLSANHARGLPPPRPARDFNSLLPEYFSDLLSRLLEKDPAQRPSSAWTLLKYLALHSDSAHRLLADPVAGLGPQLLPLLGRQREIAALDGFLQRQRQGLRAVILRGPTGVGRSRFLEELRWRYLLQGWQVVALAPELGEGLIRRLASGLGKEIGEGPAAALALAESIKNSEAARLWIHCQDLEQWSASQLQELAWLLKVFRQKNLSLGLALEINQELGDLDTLLPAAKDHLAETFDLELGDLSLTDTERLISEFDLLSKLPAEEIRELARASGGRPLLAVESARTRLEVGELKEAQPPLPKNLRQACQLKLERLSPAARAGLAVLSCAWLLADAKTLKEVTGEDSSALPELMQAGLVAAPLESEQALRLQHPSLRPLLLDLLESVEQTTAHRRWKVWLEARLAAHREDEDATLALIHHTLELGDGQTLAAWGFPALFILERRRDLPRALEWSGRLLQLPPGGIDPCALHAFRAPLFYRLARYPEALDSYRQWFALRADDESRLQKVKFHYYCGLVHFTAQEGDAARADLQACLAASDPEKFHAVRPYQAQALQLLASLATGEGHWEQAWEQLRQAASWALSDKSLAGQIQLRLGEIALRTLRWDAARLCFEKARALFSESAVPLSAMLAENSLAALEKESGHLTKALSHCEAAIRNAEAAGEHGAWARYLSNRGLILAELGRLGEAREAIRQSKDFLELFASEQEIGTAEIQEAELHFLSGNRQRFEEAFQDLVKKKPTLLRHGLWNSALLLRAHAALWHGDLGVADLLLAELEASPTLTPLERNAAGIARLQATHWVRQLRPEEVAKLTPVEHGAEAIKLEGDWPGLFQFLGRAPEENSAETYQSLVRGILDLQNPFLRQLELFHLQVYFQRHQLDGFVFRLQELRESQWAGSLSSLPEEMRMDFQKNMNLIDADQAMQAPLVPAAPKPAATVAAAETGGLSETKFRQFCEISNQLAHKSELKEILAGVMDAALLLSGAERGFLILQGGKETSLAIPGYEIRVARHLNPQALQSKDFEFSWTVVKRAVAEGSPILTQNALEEEGFRDLTSVHALQLRSVLVLPLESQGKVLGVIYLDNRHQAGSFQPADLPILLGFANQASAAIVKQQILEELQAVKSKLEVKVQDQEQRIEVLSEELSQSRDQLKYEYREIIGSSPAMMQVFKLLDHVSKTKIPVWILGESGTGKELIARSLHENSPRKSQPFIAENCGSIPENLLESELFGHKKGSFTHADRDRVGLFEQANGGTLFLDEVADMPMPMQIKLLRVLQEEEIRPVGSNKKVPIDVRLVTASNRDLAVLVEKGSFREDLFYRINGMTIHLPPLRERREDIPALVHYLMKRMAKRYQLPPCKVSEEALEFLMAQDWPGNIRQLEGVIRNSMMFADGKMLTAKILKSNGLLQARRKGGSPQAAAASPAPLASDKEGEERRKLIECLRRHNLDKKLVAEELGITPKSVYMRMAKLGIPKKNSLLLKYLNEA
ncbi:MAG: sigma 54-interacting transcriptional regulator [bacterium]